VTFNWKVPPVGTPVIQLDINPEELGRHYPNKVSLLGDAKVVLRQVISAAEANSTSLRSEWVRRTQTLVLEWREEFGPLLDSEDVPMRPERLCRDLSNHLPPDALLVADTGHSGMWTGGMVDLKKPGQGFIRAAGSLGWGFPAALGAKLALPNRPVVLFTGDGGFWYHLSELETAVRWNINLVVLVNNNRSLNQEIGPYTKAYGKLHGRHHELWHFNEVDFAKVAESLGAFGVRVHKPQELAGALEQALGAGKPAVVDVVTEITAMAPRAFVYE
jgi:acetolactate synthase-1/2/3 large subunit